MFLHVQNVITANVSVLRIVGELNPNIYPTVKSKLKVAKMRNSRHQPR